VQDALADIERIFKALAKRHGPHYRDLERRIEKLCDGPQAWSSAKAHCIGDCRYVMEPPAALKAIVRDARTLGVI